MKHLLKAGLVCIVLAGCGGAEVGDSPSTTTFVSATKTTVPVTTPTVSAEQLARAEAVGDVAIGEELFFAPMDGINHDWSCSSCHTLDGTTNGRQPSLLGISKIAEERIDGMSDVDYLRQSLTDPLVFRAGDWTGSMPYQYSDVLNEDQVNNLVAFLMTQ